LQKLLQDIDTSHPFRDLTYETQLNRLVSVGSIRELADEYSSEAERSKFLSRYGDYLLEGIKFDHLIPDPSGPIRGSDLGQQLQTKFNVNPGERFSLTKIAYGHEDFQSDTAQRARSIYKAWNKLKAGRANYEEKKFHVHQELTYSEDEK
jgi:hypothetical protein